MDLDNLRILFERQLGISLFAAQMRIPKLTWLIRKPTIPILAAVVAKPCFYYYFYWNRNGRILNINDFRCKRSCESVKCARVKSENIEIKSSTSWCNNAQRFCFCCFFVFFIFLLFRSNSVLVCNSILRLHCDLIAARENTGEEIWRYLAHGVCCNCHGFHFVRSRLISGIGK